MNRKSIQLALAVFFVAVMGAQTKVYAQNELEGRLVATVTSTNGRPFISQNGSILDCIPSLHSLKATANMSRRMPLR